MVYNVQLTEEEYKEWLMKPQKGNYDIYQRTNTATGAPIAPTKPISPLWFIMSS